MEFFSGSVTLKDVKLKRARDGILLLVLFRAAGLGRDISVGVAAVCIKKIMMTMFVNGAVDLVLLRTTEYNDGLLGGASRSCVMLHTFSQ